MTLKEAINSGKDFKRIVNPTWLSLDENDDIKIIADGSSFLATMNKEDILADDWEVKEEKLELTAAQIEDSFRTYLEGDFEEFIRSLGFKEKGK